METGRGRKHWRVHVLLESRPKSWPGLETRAGHSFPKTKYRRRQELVLSEAVLGTQHRGSSDLSAAFGVSAIARGYRGKDTVRVRGLCSLWSWPRLSLWQWLCRDVLAPRKSPLFGE